LDLDNDAAVTIYKRIIEIDAEFLPAYNNLGSLYMRLSLFPEAEGLFKTLIEKAPDFSRGYLGLAITYDKSGSRKEALGLYQKVLAMKPNSKNVAFINRRILQINTDMGRCRSNGVNLLVRVK
jgi:tetratricopeptide (TPR) repeat protein